MKSKALCALAFCLVLTVCAVAQTSQGITWRLSLLYWTGSDYDSVSFRGPVTMKKGDSFQIMVESESGGYCYVLCERPDGTLYVLNNSALEPGETILLPDDKPDYTIIDPAGTDRYHVVVSASPRTSLEKLLTKASKEGLLANPESVKDEILRIRQDSSRIALDAEKPVAMGGVTRGAKPVTATQMEGKNVYVKTISIRH